MRDSFTVAMLNSLRIGPYEQPYRANAPTAEWLIASRGGPDEAYLTISDTATPVGPDTAAAPRDLAPQNSILCVLAENADSVAEFLMLRHRPAAVAVPGRFFPADGAARLTERDGTLSLSAFGRHAHSAGTSGGRAVLHDIPDPAPNASGAITWHFQAVERPWRAAT
ncbi:MAG: hypothetical protein AAF713_21485 [Pseudomonadota bacterium]